MFTWVPLVSGIAIAETVESLSNLEVSLKWPNDVMIKGKKLGGILCESSLKGPQGGGIVVGIGVNINIRKEALPEPLIETATSLAIESGGQFDRHCVLATLLGTLESSYDLLLAGGLQSLRASYLSRCSTLGRQIQVRFVNGNCLKGFAVDIGKDGSLQMIPSTNTSPPCTPRPSVIEIRAGDVLHLD